MRKLLWICAAFLLASAVCSAQEEKPLLLQQPTVNRTHVVFAYAGDLWSVAAGRRSGAAFDDQRRHRDVAAFSLPMESGLHSAGNMTETPMST